MGESATANPVIQGEEGSSKVAKTILKVNIKWVHDCLGHLSKDATCKIAAQLGMELSRTTFQTCETCAIGKAKQRNIPKELQERKQPYSMKELVMTYQRSKLWRGWK
jgi:hypothetical protein